MTNEFLFNDPGQWLHERALEQSGRLIALRRDIHAHPELAFEETRTAGLVAAELSRLGITHRTGVGRTGVLGVIEGERPGPTLAIRADMDALPIHEETGRPMPAPWRARCMPAGTTSTLSPCSASPGC
ncbi:hypothetical protein [Teichococcus aestuarii]|uniref:hypothetical protein n=1 Tax=Teichococcus aestuarii TaxID=568898 RepID=UPI003616050E